MNKKQPLDQISEQVKKCQKCPLYQGTNNPVPGEGNPNSEIMFIGEGPGFHEDRLGRPFVGQAGKLLEKALAQIGLNRDDVWIGNVIKHRPPNNRDPLPQEIKTCEPFLDQQIKIICPKIIATLGRFSMSKFIPDAKISQIHGQARWVDWQNLRFLIMPLYHPAAALRNGQIMNQFLEDFAKLPELLKTVNNPVPTELANPAQEAENNTDEQLSMF